MIYKYTALQLKNFVRKGELTALEITEAFLKRIRHQDEKVKAFLNVLSEKALKKASEIDQKRAQGKPLGALAGIPIAIKDNIHIKDEITSCASKFLANYVAPFDATVTENIEKEDGIIIGKTNLDEFAMGSSSENSAFHPTHNPWDLAYSPGGSSSGSAAAVAARLCSLSLGSDTGGSIRQPAAFTGIVGFKPSYGRVSRYGLVAFGSSLDQIGPFSTTVEDAALLMETLAHPCLKDSTSIQTPSEPYLNEISTSIHGKKIGVPWKFLENLSPKLHENFENALSIFKDLGAQIIDFEFDLMKYGIPLYYLISNAEASTNLARFDGIRYGLRSKRAKTLNEIYEYSKEEGFGSEVKCRILLGTFILSSSSNEAYYKKALKVRTLFIKRFHEVFNECDVIMMPSSPNSAFKMGEILDPVQMYLQDIYTVFANIAGLPCISIPSGFTDEKMPLGIQIAGPQFEDARVLRFAYHFEKASKMSSMIPSLFDQEVP